jgi:transcriptional regulator with XRE-family HTH domain
MARPRDSELAARIGAHARAARVAAGLTQEQLAERVGVQAAAVSRFENGAVGFSLGTLRDITDALGIPLASLFDDAGAVRSDLSAEEAALVAIWRSLPTSHRHTVRDVLRWATADAGGVAGGGVSPPPQ